MAKNTPRTYIWKIQSPHLRLHLDAIAHILLRQYAQADAQKKTGMKENLAGVQERTETTKIASVDVHVHRMMTNTMTEIVSATDVTGIVETVTEIAEIETEIVIVIVIETAETETEIETMNAAENAAGLKESMKERKDTETILEKGVYCEIYCIAVPMV